MSAAHGHGLALIALCIAGCGTTAASNQGDGGDGGLVDDARPDATSTMDHPVATPDATGGIDGTDDGPVVGPDAVVAFDVTTDDAPVATPDAIVGFDVTDDGPVAPADVLATPADDGPAPTSDVPNVSCLAATPITAGVTLRGQDVASSVERLPHCTPSPTDPGRRALYYTITVPARTALVVASHREDGVTGALASYQVEVRPPCGIPGCFATAFSTSSSAPVGQYNNASDAPQDVVVAVPGSDAFPLPVVDLTATLRALPTNHRCASAVTLADGVAVSMEHPEDATDPTPRCPGAADYAPRALYYAINVPAGQSVDVGVDSPATPGAARESSVRLFTACGGACLAARTHELISPRLVYANGSASPQRVVVAAAGAAPGAFPGPLVLRASLRPTAANVTCAGARPLAAGTTIEGIDLLEAQGASPCGGFGGRVLYYSVPVTTGATLTLTTTGGSPGTSPASPTLSVVSGCGGVCLGQGTSSTLRYVHRGAAQTVIVAVGQPSGTPITDRVTLSARVE